MNTNNDNNNMTNESKICKLESRLFHIQSCLDRMASSDLPDDKASKRSAKLKQMHSAITARIEQLRNSKESEAACDWKAHQIEKLQHKLGVIQEHIASCQPGDERLDRLTGWRTRIETRLQTLAKTDQAFDRRGKCDQDTHRARLESRLASIEARLAHVTSKKGGCVDSAHVERLVASHDRIARRLKMLATAPQADEPQNQQDPQEQAATDTESPQHPKLELFAHLRRRLQHVKQCAVELDQTIADPLVAERGKQLAAQRCQIECKLDALTAKFPELASFEPSQTDRRRFFGHRAHHRAASSPADQAEETAPCHRRIDVLTRRLEELVVKLENIQLDTKPNEHARACRRSFKPRPYNGPTFVQRRRPYPLEGCIENRSSCSFASKRVHGEKFGRPHAERRPYMFRGSCDFPARSYFPSSPAVFRPASSSTQGHPPYHRPHRRAHECEFDHRRGFAHKRFGGFEQYHCRSEC